MYGSEYWMKIENRDMYNDGGFVEWKVEELLKKILEQATFPIALQEIEKEPMPESDIHKLDIELRKVTGEIMKEHPHLRKQGK